MSQNTQQLYRETSAALSLAQANLATFCVETAEQEMRLLRAYNEAKAENTRLRAACQFTLDIAENKVIGNWDDVMLEMRLVLAKARS